MLIQLTHSCRDRMERSVTGSGNVIFLCLLVLAREDRDDNYDDQNNNNDHHEDGEFDVVPAYLVLGVPLRAVVSAEVIVSVTIVILRAFNVNSNSTCC